MPTSFIHLLISENQPIIFSNPLLERLKERYPGAVFFDLDNHSDTQMTEYAIRLIKASEDAVVIIRKQSGTPKNCIKLADTIIRHPASCKVILIGNDPLLEKMLAVGKNFVQVANEDEAENAIR